jgi:hypothetical protein
MLFTDLHALRWYLLFNPGAFRWTEVKCLHKDYSVGVIQQLRGLHFTQFCPHRVDKNGHFTYYTSTLCHVTHRGLSTDTPTPSYCSRSC